MIKVLNSLSTGEPLNTISPSDFEPVQFQVLLCNHVFIMINGKPRELFMLNMVMVLIA